MKLKEEELKGLYQRQTARPAPERTSCPTGETLVRAFAGQLNQAEDEIVTNHLIVCSDCAQEYRLLHSLHPLAEQLAGTPSESADAEKAAVAPAAWLARIRARWEQLAWAPQWRAAVLVATVAVAVGGSVALWQWERSGEPTPQYRGELSLMTNVEPSHQAVLDQAPRQLVWPAVQSAERYQVVLYDAELTVIWESPRVASTSVILPEPERQQLRRGQRYYWRVIVVSGIDHRQSKLFQFSLATDGHE
jgi:hypothetical protein